MLSQKCGVWPYLFAIIVANGKILLDIAGVNASHKSTGSSTSVFINVFSGRQTVYLGIYENKDKYII